MRQIIQNLKSGETYLENVPVPQVRPGCVLIQTTRTLVSIGTERSLVEFGRANLLQKARQQPDKVRQVLDKINTDGLLPTLDTVFKRLDEPLPLGYCNVGTVVEVGSGVTEFSVGDKVASNGHHAEFVCVPKNLVVRVPDGVSDDHAAFTVVGSIALQGVRLCKPELGETVVVVGLGLVGLLAAELLLASGCSVIGVDLDAKKLEIAANKGVTPFNPSDGRDLVRFVHNATREVGADAVVITASAKGDTIISESARMSRKRGRIILVGVVGLHLNRAEFYEKELSFQVSCSYGPGRYDPLYEQQGVDYPVGFVRWTENRNFAAVLQMIQRGMLDVAPLISESVPLEEYHQVYGNMQRSNIIASLIEYNQKAEPARTVTISSNSARRRTGKGIAIIGAGNFTKMTLLPILASLKANMRWIVSSEGLSGTLLARKYGIENSTTDVEQVLTDPDVGMVMIMTRHNQHAPMIIQALQAGKHVFVEKPLALNAEQLQAIQSVYDGSLAVNVGFNRRFSPHIRKVKSIIGSAPVSIVITVNAGHVPKDSWLHDPEVGGGRIIGEACHFVDLISFISGSKIIRISASGLGQHADRMADTVSILMHCENGSIGVVNYFANGSKAYPKERVEVFSEGQTLIIDNFRTTTGYGTKGLSRLKTKIDKGHAGQFSCLLSGLEENSPEIVPFLESKNVSLATYAILRSCEENRWVDVK